MTKNKNNYKDSGVDIGQGQKFVEDIKKLINVLEKPYEKTKENIDYQSPAPVSDKKYKTFCGT